MKATTFIFGLTCDYAWWAHIMSFPYINIFFYNTIQYNTIFHGYAFCYQFSDRPLR